MNIKKVQISELKPAEYNPRKDLQPKDEEYMKIKNSVLEFGCVAPIIVNSDMTIIGGHQRLKVLQELGYTEIECNIVDLDKNKERALNIALNKISGEWDNDKLEELLAELKETDIDMNITGFSFEEIDDMLNDVTEIKDDDDFDVDKELNNIEEPISKLGDIWVLGRHRLMCGDCTNESNISRLLGKNNIDLVFTDPPYGMKKEKYGVLNDNLNEDELLKFNKKWIPLSFKFLRNMGSWYCWGIDEPLFDIYSSILKPLIRDNKIVFRNYITWAKHSAFGMKSDLMLQYPRETEKCLFVVKGQYWNNSNTDFFNTKYEKILDYLLKEAKKVNLTRKKLYEITGVKMYGHWFSKSQFTIIPQKYYEMLTRMYEKKGAFQISYEELNEMIGNDNNLNLKPYVDITWFDDGDIPLTDVWRNSITSQKERELTGEHATPKPLAICERAIRTSSRENGNVLDLFGGSGSTLIACEQANRNCYMMELDPKYCDVIIKRWESLTGQKAKLEE